MYFLRMAFIFSLVSSFAIFQHSIAMEKDEGRRKETPEEYRQRRGLRKETPEEYRARKGLSAQNELKDEGHRKETPEEYRQRRGLRKETLEEYRARKGLFAQEDEEEWDPCTSKAYKLFVAQKEAAYRLKHGLKSPEAAYELSLERDRKSKELQAEKEKVLRKVKEERRQRERQLVRNQEQKYKAAEMRNYKYSSNQQDKDNYCPQCSLSKENPSEPGPFPIVGHSANCPIKKFHGL